MKRRSIAALCLAAVVDGSFLIPAFLNRSLR
jgi:hypothetical protein